MNSAELLKLPVWLNYGTRAKALIDSGSQVNFISQLALERAGLRPKRKKKSYDLLVATGRPMPGSPRVTHEVTTMLEITHHEEQIILDVLPASRHDVVLGLPWLRQHTMEIDWKQGRLRLTCCSSALQAPTHRQRSMVDERVVNTTISRPEVDKHENNLADAGQTSQVIKRKNRDNKSTPLEIPEEYMQWRHIFEEREGTANLPKHQPWDHAIDLEEGKIPPFGPLYAKTGKELEQEREFIKTNEKKGYIRPSKSSAASPFMFVAKKDGTPRPCVDYRKLNAITIKNRYPLPNVTELRDRLARAKIFTKLDLRDGYHLIRIKEGDEWKTAFRTRYGLYEYQVMPFGLTNAPATFQALVNDVLRNYLDIFTVAYMDDILIFSENEREHTEHVKLVLTALDKAHLRVKPKKCEFSKTELEFLGIIVSTTGIRVSPEKVEAVKNWKVPQNLKQVREILGFSGFSRIFIQDYATITKPLTDLTRKDKPWTWGPEQQNAFETLKKANMEPPVLVTFHSDEPMQVWTDASDLALGACAKQERNGNWHPIAYWSYKLKGAETRYEIHDKELFAIVKALKHWRTYALSCSDLTIFTDHKNLQRFTTTKELTPRQGRWSEALGQFKFKIIYTPGRENGQADVLSRRDDLAGEKESTHASILKQNPDGSLEPSRELNNTLVIRREVPEPQQEEIIRQHHDDPVHGHQGIIRTCELIQRNYDFKGIKQKVTDYIKKCAECQKNKHSTHAPYGEMQAIQIPDEPWTDVSMDFITGLPKSKDPTTNFGYNAILVIVDRFTKYAEFIPFHNTFTAKQLAFLILDRLIKHHGIPRSIISDRDKLFTSNYWTTLMALIGTRRKLSTAYHPQTDGQTERTNRTLKTYLRIYSNTNQNNWISLLPMAQLAYNNKEAEATGRTPFYANHGRHPHLFERTLPTETKAAEAEEMAQSIQKIHEEMKTKMEEKQQKSIAYNNQKRKKAPQLERGDKAYLLTKNLRTTRPSKGLDHVKVGPFLVLERLGPVNYRLQLPSDARIHSVFHVSLLEPADPDTPLQETFYYQADQEEEFEVEKILNHRSYNPREYLVKWKGYPESENTWEPEDNLQNCQQLLRSYKQRNPPMSGRGNRN